MKLLVSPVDIEEAEEAIKGGADIVDVKNPQEGSLGANFPWVIKEISSILPSDRELSATIGDLDYKPGTASLAAYGVASLNIDYVKAGFYGIKNKKQAQKMTKAIMRSLESFNCKLVLGGYADFQKIDSISPMELPDVGADAGVQVVMIDTAIKNGNSLLDNMDLEVLQGFVDSCHEHGLESALAGSLDIDAIGLLADTGVDIIGVRGAACSDNDRTNGRISGDKVRSLKNLIG